MEMPGNHRGTTNFVFLVENPDPSEDEIRVGMSGNLCRCTGYQGIVRAIKAAADESKELTR